MFQLDIRTLKHYNRRVKQLKSYQGTPDELPGDPDRLRQARKAANAFLLRMLSYHLGGDLLDKMGSCVV